MPKELVQNPRPSDPQAIPMQNNAARIGSGLAPGAVSLSQKLSAHSDSQRMTSEVSLKRTNASTKEGQAAALSQPNIESKATAFKDWATQQVKASQGRTHDVDAPHPAATPMQTPLPYIEPKVNIETNGSTFQPGGLGEELAEVDHRLLPSQKSSETYMVARDPIIQSHRSTLPAVRMEHEIVETILTNQVVVITGETGSGKTTQIPQFLYERGFGRPGSGRWIHSFSH